MHMAINEAAGKHIFPREADPWVKEGDTDDRLVCGETGDAALWASRAYAGREHVPSLRSPARGEKNSGRGGLTKRYPERGTPPSSGPHTVRG